MRPFVMRPLVAAVSSGQPWVVPAFAAGQAVAGAIPVAQEIVNRRQTVWCCDGSRTVCLLNQGVIVMPAAPPDAVQQHRDECDPAGNITDHSKRFAWGDSGGSQHGPLLTGPIFDHPIYRVNRNSSLDKTEGNSGNLLML